MGGLRITAAASGGKGAKGYRRKRAGEQSLEQSSAERLSSGQRSRVSILPFLPCLLVDFAG